MCIGITDQRCFLRQLRPSQRWEIREAMDWVYTRLMEAEA
jgi:hypothetical protein